MSADSTSNTDDIWPVEELTAEVMRKIADRIAVAGSFADLIYRESEIDALWSLADIEARDAKANGAADADRKAELLSKIGEAHDLIPEGQCAEAAEIIRKAVALLP